MSRLTSMACAVLVTAAVTLFAPVAPASAQGGACLNDRQIDRAVERGAIAPLAGVLRSNGIGRGVDVLSKEVCETPRGLAYFVNLLDPSGEARTLVLPASP